MFEMLEPRMLCAVSDAGESIGASVLPAVEWMPEPGCEAVVVVEVINEPVMIDQATIDWGIAKWGGHPCDGGAERAAWCGLNFDDDVLEYAALQTPGAGDEGSPTTAAAVMPDATPPVWMAAIGAAFTGSSVVDGLVVQPAGGRRRGR